MKGDDVGGERGLGARHGRRGEKHCADGPEEKDAEDRSGE